jgi:hypothetical protein
LQPCFAVSQTTTWQRQRQKRGQHPAALPQPFGVLAFRQHMTSSRFADTGFKSQSYLVRHPAHASCALRAMATAT